VFSAKMVAHAAFCHSGREEASLINRSFSS